MKEELNNIEYWYPKIKDLVPTPRTIIVPIKWELHSDGEAVKVNEKSSKAVEKEARRFLFPIFMKGSVFSGKHDWKNLCFVKNIKDIKDRVWKLVYEATACDIFGGVPCTSIALREFILMDSKFTAFWGEMPVNPERRYFINKGKVICHHPYWFEDAIRSPSHKLWKELLKDMNRETKEEIKLLTSYAEKIAKVFDEFWSIDFCRAKSGKWYMIDMADGLKSWHQDDCKIKQELTCSSE